jgi:twitching motility two-component system response regulator PilH
MAKLRVVDDDESVRKLLRFRLRGSHEVIETGSPEEALALALHEKPDAILLDLMMPKYSGFEICQTISSLSFTQHIPIIIVSGESSASYKEFCESLGAKDYMQKPVDFEVLSKKLASLISAHSSAQREPRVRLRVALKLRPVEGPKNDAEVLAVTESVRASGFTCGYYPATAEGQTFEVFQAKNGQHFIGKVKADHIEWKGTPGQRVEFTFLGTPAEWILR